MKKMALAIIAFAMVMTGLGVGTAQAAPYPGSVPTRTIIVHNRSVIPSGARAEMTVRVVPISGTAVVKGTLWMTCSHPKKGGGTLVRTGPRRSYTGPNKVFLPGPALWVRTKWACTAHFTGGGSVFAASDAGPRTVTVV